MKCYLVVPELHQDGSPSVWRVWIEISFGRTKKRLLFVTLRVEGVD